MTGRLDPQPAEFGFRTRRNRQDDKGVLRVQERGLRRVGGREGATSRGGSLTGAGGTRARFLALAHVEIVVLHSHDRGGKQG